MDDRVRPHQPDGGDRGRRGRRRSVARRHQPRRVPLLVHRRPAAAQPHHEKLHRRGCARSPAPIPSRRWLAYQRSRPALDDNQIAVTLLGDIAFRLPTLRMMEARAGRGASTGCTCSPGRSPVQGGGSAPRTRWTSRSCSEPSTRRASISSSATAPIAPRSRARCRTPGSHSRDGRPVARRTPGVAALGPGAPGDDDLRRAVPARARSLPGGEPGLEAATVRGCTREPVSHCPESAMALRERSEASIAAAAGADLRPAETREGQTLRGQRLDHRREWGNMDPIAVLRDCSKESAFWPTRSGTAALVRRRSGSTRCPGVPRRRDSDGAPRRRLSSSRAAPSRRGRRRAPPIARSKPRAGSCSARC